MSIRRHDREGRQMPDVILGEVIAPARVPRAGTRNLPILSMTMAHGLVPQDQKFKKRVASEDTSPYKIVRRGQLVVGFPIDEGVLAFQDWHDEAIISPAYDVWDVRPDVDVWRPYLQRYLRSPKALRFFAAKLQSTTARRRSLPDDLFLSLPVALPSLSEQRRIAAILDEADALRAKRRAALAHLDEMARAIFVEMFGHPDFNPKRLTRAKLGDLIKLKSGDFLPASAMVPGDHLVFGGNGVSGHHNAYNTPERRIVIGRVGAYCGCVHIAPPQSWITDNAMWIADMRSDIDFEYLVFALREANLNRVASQFGQPLISGSRVYPVPILVPRLEQQREFVSRLSSIGELQEIGHRSTAQMDAFFASLQHRAFRGEL